MATKYITVVPFALPLHLLPVWRYTKFSTYSWWIISTCFFLLSLFQVLWVWWILLELLQPTERNLHLYPCKFKLVVRQWSHNLIYHELPSAQKCEIVLRPDQSQLEGPNQAKFSLWWEIHVGGHLCSSWLPKSGIQVGYDQIIIIIIHFIFHHCHYHY